MGGGGPMLDWSLPLDEYVLGLTGRERPRICMLATASGDADHGIVLFYRRFQGRAEATHLPLFSVPADDLRSRLLGQDVIYVGGGNTANMLAIWALHGVDAILTEAWSQGAILCGWSAGSICWFESGVTDSFGARLDALPCLGLLSGSNCPHYDGEAQRRPAYHRLVAAGMPAGIAADDGVGLHYRGTELAEVVSCREGAQAYLVEAGPGGVRETALPARMLAAG